MSIIISNASPLIGLAGIDLLHILKELWTEIVIPDAVYKEVVIEGGREAKMEYNIRGIQRMDKNSFCKK